MLVELGIECVGPVELYSDSSAARCFATRRGVGRMRHLEVRHLWLQEEVSSHRVQLRRVAGEANPADLMTKYLSIRNILKCFGFMNLRWISRSRISAPAEGGCQPPGTFQSYKPRCVQVVGEEDVCMPCCPDLCDCRLSLFTYNIIGNHFVGYFRLCLQQLALMLDPPSVWLKPPSQRNIRTLLLAW